MPAARVRRSHARRALVWSSEGSRAQNGWQSTSEAEPIFADARTLDVVRKSHVEARYAGELLVVCHKAIHAALAGALRVRSVADRAKLDVLPGVVRFDL